jgi:thiol:disulfide interchange protein DsbD
VIAKTLLISALLLAPLWSPAYAQLTPSKEKVDFSFVPGTEKYEPSASHRLLFRLKFKEGWHSQSHNPTMESLVPTALTVTAESAGITIGRVIYPEGKLTTFSFSPQPLSTFAQTTYIGVTVAVDPSTAPGNYKLKAKLKIQACDDKSCLVPSETELDVAFAVASKGEAVKTLNDDVYTANAGLFADTSAKAGGESGSIKKYFDEQGLFVTLLFVFLGGLALNLTPCVYPLIPITVSYFGGESETKKGRLFVHAALYLLGMSTMYSAMGLFAALTGSLFGGILQHWSVTLLLAGVMVALSLAMFGVYEIRMPSALTDIGGKNRQGFFGTFMMGLTVGIIAAPCIGPFVLGLLTFVGEKGDPLLGFSMFFALSLGLGLPFVVLAMFSGALSSLPRSGMWMVWVKQVFGFIMLLMAVYFLQPLLPKNWYAPVLGLTLAVAGVTLGWITKVAKAGRVFKGIRWVTGLAFIAGGVFFLVPAKGESGPRITWEKATVIAIESAKTAGKPVIVDFTADWCLPCKELESFTFSDKSVVEFSRSFVMLKADVTTGGDAEIETLKKRFNVAGVPTIVFIGKDGAEKAELRVVGFADAPAFLGKMKGAGGG